MNFFKRAFTSIKRNLGKTCLLFLIVLILGSVISGTISANQAAENTERNLMANMLTIARIDVNWNAIDEEYGMGWWENPELDIETQVSSEMINRAGALPYVSSYDLFIEAGSMSMRSIDLQRYVPEMPEHMGGGGMNWDDSEELGPAFSIRGGNNPAIFDIEQGLIELVAGRTFTETEMQAPDNNVALVSQAFADLNGLTVGSTMNFRNIVFNHDTSMMWNPEQFTEENIFAEEAYVLYIIGIFAPVAELNTGDPWMDNNLLQNISNRIYVPNSFSETVARFTAEATIESWPDEWRTDILGNEFTADDWVQPEHFFSLYDAAELQAFREAVAEIVPSHFQVTDAGGSLQGVDVALQSMRSLTQTILWLAIGASILILTLLITLFLRDRKREVGIYLALGEKKRKLVSQFVVEIIVVAFISIVVALFLGNILSSTLSENMLINDLTAEQADGTQMSLWEDNPFMWQGYVNVVDTDEIIASYDVSLNLMTILLFFAIGLGTTLIATVIPMIYVVRLNPKKIMM